MTQDSPEKPVPPAFNGKSTPGLRTADGIERVVEMLSLVPQAVNQLLPQLPPAIGQAVAQAVRIPQQFCAQCLTTRITWENKHEKTLLTASEQHTLAAAEAATKGLPAPPVEMFLPEALRPGQTDGMPQVLPGVTTVAGTVVCAGHIPGLPGKPGAKTLLIANAPLSSSMLAQFAA
jgi:hypothetical protein